MRPRDKSESVASLSSLEKEKEKEKEKEVESHEKFIARKLKEHRGERVQIFFFLFFGYVFHYMSRRTVNLVLPSLRKDLLSASEAEGQFDKGIVGLFGSMFSIMFATSKLTSGVLSDLFSPSKLFFLALSLTGFVHLAFFASENLWVLVLLWGANGYIQGLGFPAASKLVANWFQVHEKGTMWSFLTTGQNFGGSAIPYIAATIMVHFSWRYVMLFVGLADILLSIIVFFQLRDDPSHLGIPKLDLTSRLKATERKNEVANQKPNENGTSEVKVKDSRLSQIKEVIALLRKHVFSQIILWKLSFLYLLIHFMRSGFYDWLTIYLVEERGYTNYQISSVLFFFEVGGVSGNVFCGWLSDSYFRGRRDPVILSCLIGCFLSFSTLSYIVSTNDLQASLPQFVFLFISSAQVESYFLNLSVFFVGASISGPHLLVGLFASEVVDKSVSATATGFVGIFSAFGGVICGYPLGVLIQNYGWSFYFMLLISIALLGIVVFSNIVLVHLSNRTYPQPSSSSSTAKTK